MGRGTVWIGGDLRSLERSVQGAVQSGAKIWSESGQKVVKMMILRYPRGSGEVETMDLDRFGQMKHSESMSSGLI